ncbi:MAG: CoA-binding protein [Deltaproteobacteria bacterium]|nr:CoA-binding protein [Deltaproteobacteria bacterium]
MKPRQLDFEQSRTLLEKYGIIILGREVRTIDQATDAAGAIGYPVVLKAVDERIIHKTDVGCVFLELESEAELRAAHARLLDNVRAAGFGAPEALLVQAMVRPGLEILIGATQDPSFGPMTMVGSGGQMVELLADVAPGIGVLDEKNVLAMLARTKAGQVLDGFRGQPLDKKAVVDLAARVSRLMSEHPEIHELDLNPVIVHEQGIALVDARIIVGDPVHYPRQTDVSPGKMRSLDTIFAPKSVVVYGASHTGTVGGIVLKNLRRRCAVYPINPRATELQGRPCYPNLDSLPETPELAVFVVNSETVVREFERFCQAGGKGAIIVSDGFAESGRRELEERLRVLSAAHDVAYIGPNCLGIIDNFSGVNTLFIPDHRTGVIREQSGIGIISQSGGIGLELMEMLHADRIGVGKWVSCGNSSSVGAAEILAHMGQDPRINVIAIYLEGLSEGLKLMEVGRKVTAHKPVIIIKGGSGGGREATMSHTASLAGSHEAFRACCSQAGFHLIEELTEDPKIMVNVLSILTTQPPARGKRTAVVSVGGGAAVLLADQITAEGMELARFAPETRTRLQDLLRENVKAANPDDLEQMLVNIGNNPMDLFGNCDDRRLLRALEIIADDPNTDVILAAIYLQVPYLSEYLAERLVDFRRTISKPFIVSPRGLCTHVTRFREALYAKRFHTYTVPMIKPLSMALDIWRRHDKSFMNEHELREE